jgi:hypothetical protein
MGKRLKRERIANGQIIDPDSRRFSDHFLHEGLHGRGL